MMHKKLVWNRLIAQSQIKEVLSQAFNGNTLGHAYLFCGKTGTGTFQAALELGMAMLCVAGGEAPCYSCESCQKVLRHAHADFHVIVPVSLDKEHRGADGKLNADGWNLLAETALSRIGDPYVQAKYSSAPSIPVEWVKEVNHAILRGPVSGAHTVAIIDCVDIMNKESANAMLKTLEEPPAGTLIILVTSRPQTLLPTIASRCQTARLGWLPPEQIRHALDVRLGDAVSETIRLEAVKYCDGSLGRAIELCEKPSGTLTEEALRLLQECSAGDWLPLAVHVDEMVRQADYEHNERLLLHLIHLIRTHFLQKITPSGTYFDMMGAAGGTTGVQRPISATLVSTPDIAARFVAACQDALSGIRVHGNASIVLVTFIISLMEIVHEQKQ